MATGALERQCEVRREADFKYPTLERVRETIRNGKPANAADLDALTHELLCGLARDMRHGDTSDWRQYWNVDRYNRPLRPRPEEACRDAILSDLRSRLYPHGAAAQPEGICADGKRTDIRVSCGRFNVPIEIKKSHSEDLWRWIRCQLIAKYARGPGCDGYGIYLVFWCGAEPDRPCKPPPSGPAPETPDELRVQLLARAKLPPEERRKIAVCIIDVSRPGPPSADRSAGVRA